MLLVIVEERFIVAFQQMSADSLNLIEYVSALDGSQIFFHAKFNKPYKCLETDGDIPEYVYFTES